MNMKTDLSSLMDGEAGEPQAQAVFKALKHDRKLRAEAELYILIGDALRGEPGLSTDLSSKVMAALEKEPVILAPRRSAWLRPAMAIAAGLAGIVVVGAVVFLPSASGDHPASAGIARIETPAEAKLAAANMREYLIAHQAHSAGMYVGSSSQQIRTVSLVDRGDSK